MNIITAYNGKNNNVIKPFLNRIIDYCTLHNYNFEFVIDNFDNSSYKSLFINKKINQYNLNEYVIWMDIDCYIVDLNFKIENITCQYNDKHILFSKDDNGLCSGFTIIKNSEFTRKFYETLSFLYECNQFLDLKTNSEFGGFLHQNGSHYDQDVIKVLTNYFPNISNKIGLIDESIVKNRNSITIKRPFIYHFWGIWNNEEEVFKKINVDNF